MCRRFLNSRSSLLTTRSGGINSGTTTSGAMPMVCAFEYKGDRMVLDKMVLDKMVRTKWYWTKWYWTKWYWTKWYGQNGMDKMVATFIDSNSTELNFYSVITSHK